MRSKNKLPTHDHATWDQRDYAFMAEKPNKAINRPVYYMEYLKNGLPNPKPKGGINHGTDRSTDCKH